MYNKNPLSLAGQRVSVELLSRFELETSSLPIRRNLFYAVSIRVNKYPQVLAPQGFAGYCVLAHLSVLLPVCWKICWKMVGEKLLHKGWIEVGTAV